MRAGKTGHNRPGIGGPGGRRSRILAVSNAMRLGRYLCRRVGFQKSFRSTAVAAGDRYVVDCFPGNPSSCHTGPRAGNGGGKAAEERASQAVLGPGIFGGRPDGMVVAGNASFWRRSGPGR